MFKFTFRIYRKTCSLIDAHKILADYNLKVPLDLDYIMDNANVPVVIDYYIQIFPFKWFVNVYWN